MHTAGKAKAANSAGTGAGRASGSTASASTKKAAPVRKSAPTRTQASSKPAAAKAPRGNATPASTRSAARPITPRQALANTRKLLKAKQAQARETPAWQALDGSHGHGHAGAPTSSDEAHAKADELHAAESRMQAIQGSVGTQGRHDQGKRDKR